MPRDEWLDRRPRFYGYNPEAKAQRKHEATAAASRFT